MMSVKTLKYIKAKTSNEALNYKNNIRNSQFIAGGTDIMVHKIHGNKVFDCLIDLTGIIELQQISKENDFIKIGSCVCLSDLACDDLIKSEFPALSEAALSVASPVIRKSATLGGNLLCENRCIFYNQSEFWRKSAGYCLKCNGNICLATGGKKKCFAKHVSDTAPVLISMNALIDIENNEGKKIMKLEDIYSGNGIKPLLLEKNFVLKNILIPRRKNINTIFKKLRHRKTLEFTSLTSAVSIDKYNKIKIAIGGIAPKPVILNINSEIDKETIINETIKKTKTVNNDMFSRKYRKEILKVYIRKSLDELYK